MNNPQTIRQLNERDALNALFEKGGMSRADLARVLGLNRSSTGNIVASLIAAGLVVEAAGAPRPDERRTGRPGIAVRLAPDGGAFAGVEINVDRLSVVVIDLTAATVAEHTVALDSPALPPEEVIGRAAALFLDVLPAAARDRLKGVCVTVPALLDHDGNARNAHMLGWRDTPVTALFRAALPFEAEIAAENDANAFAIGQLYRGGYGPAKTAVFLHIETGVGGAITLDGRLFRGAYGFAGEFGHLTISRGGRPARRGTTGELETLIGKDRVLDSYEDAGGVPDLARFLAALAAGDAAARRIAEAWADDLGYGLAQFIKVFDPDLVVLGGSVAPIYRHVADRVRDTLDTLLIVGVPRRRIEVSAQGASGAALGAACRMHQRFLNREDR